VSEVARSDNQQIMAKLDRLAEEVARMRALQETETARCPHREDIARAKNNVARIEKVESKLVEVDDAIGALRLNWAKLIAALVGSSVLGGVLADPLAAILKALGGG
jgi:hypothetical protein